MKKSSTAETSNQKAKGSVAAPTIKASVPANPIPANPIPANPIPANPIPTDTTDAPMHAAQGNDDIMSQPQASRIGKKKS